MARSPRTRDESHYNWPVRRNVPVLIIAAMAILAGLTTAWSFSQSRAVNRSIGIIATCSNSVTRQPSQLIATCADANSMLTKLKWMQWGDATAYAAGIARWNDCTPSCVAGHWRSEPVTAWAWDIKNNLYTHLESSDPRFFSSSYVVAPYPPAG